MYEKTDDPESFVSSAVPSFVPSFVPSYVKQQFVARVYALVSLQLFTTASVAFLMTTVTEIDVARYPDVYTASLIVSCVSLMTFSCVRTYPWNMALFSAFTLSESVCVGFVCVVYVSHGRGVLIISSVAATCLIFVCLSTYVHLSNRNFRWLEPFLISGSIVLVLASLLVLVFSMSFTSVLTASCGILLFTGFVLYDTSALIHDMTVDDALIGAMQLYTDVINIFLYFLQCLTISSRE